MLAHVFEALGWLGKFALVFLVTTIICTTVWEFFVKDHLYNDTDGGFLDYLDPGDWVVAFDGHPIETVPHVVLDRNMEHPDTLEAGWTVERLWYLWFALLATSIGVSAALASMPWQSSSNP